jgi:hypothetical protein
MSLPPPIFKDPLLQSKFDQDGFVVVPFLNPSQIAELDEFFDSEHTEPIPSGFYSGSFSADKDYKERCSSKIMSYLAPKYEEIFQNYDSNGATFLYKVPGPESELACHHDWSTVEEECAVAINCWIPLTTTNLENGPLYFLPGSQFSNHPIYRGPSIPFFFQGNDDILLKYMVPICVEAGTAIFLNQSVIHYSSANRSGLTRKAITAGVKTKGSPMLMHYLNHQNNEIESYRQSNNFLLEFEDFSSALKNKPQGQMISSIPYISVSKKRDELEKWARDTRNKSSFPLENKTFNWLRRWF